MMDENDLTDEEIMAMWDEAEPVELVVSTFEVDPSAWLGTASSTSTEGDTLLSKLTYPRYFSSHSRGYGPLTRPETETALEQIA
jgi:hypothetical protein